MLLQNRCKCNIAVLHLEISQSLMIIQLLTHFLKSLINQLCDISRCNTQSNLSTISLFKNFKFKNSTHKILILSSVKNGLSCAFLSDAAGFIKITL